MRRTARRRRDASSSRRWRCFADRQMRNVGPHSFRPPTGIGVTSYRRPGVFSGSSSSRNHEPMIFMATVPSTNGSRPSAKFGSRQQSFRKASPQHLDRGDSGLVVELNLSVGDEGPAAGARKIQRIDVVEALVPRRLERRPQRPAVEAAVAVGIPGQPSEGVEQLGVSTRRRDAGCRQQVDVVHQHLGIRLPRQRVDSAIGQPQRAEHRRRRTLRQARRRGGERVEPHHAAGSDEPGQQCRRDVGGDVRRRAGDDGRKQNFFGRTARGQRLHTDLYVRMLAVPLLREPRREPDPRADWRLASTSA